MPHFEVFDKRAIPMSKRPQVTIQSKGTISLNASSYHALGQPRAVELLYDRADRIIGFRPASVDSPNAYPMRGVGGSAGTYLVAGGAFLKYYDIPFGKPMRYDAEFAEGVLMIDLKKEGRIAISNRNRAAAMPSPEDLSGLFKGTPGR